jgi:hypothetical protein
MEGQEIKKKSKNETAQKKERPAEIFGFFRFLLIK